MKSTYNHTSVVAIAVIAGLIATCDAIVVGIDHEETLMNINGFLTAVMFLLPLVVVTGSIIKFSNATGTVRGDTARAFLGLTVVGLLTPAIMVTLKLIDPGNSPQQAQSDVFYSVAIWSSLVIGGVIVLTGLIGWLILRRGIQKPDAHNGGQG